MKDGLYEFNGTQIEVRNNLIDLTAICQANGKRFNDFDADPSRHAFLVGLSQKTNLPVFSRGNDPALIVTLAGRGHRSWGTEPVAMYFCFWASAECAIWFMTEVAPQHRDEIFRRAGVQPDQRSFAELEVEALTAPSPQIENDADSDDAQRYTTIGGIPDELHAADPSLIKCWFEKFKTEIRIGGQDLLHAISDAFEPVRLALDQWHLDAESPRANTRILMRLHEIATAQTRRIDLALAIVQTTDPERLRYLLRQLRYMTRMHKAPKLHDDRQQEWRW